MIQVSRLSRSFDDRRAIEDLTFEVKSGEIFGLLGPNGAGKTTTLRVIAGLIAPTEGTVAIDGAPLTRQTADRLRARIGVLTEVPGLWERLDVRTNLLVYARLHQVARPERVVAAALDRFGLADRASSLAGELSKGMKQKAAIARALLHEPPVVLLDEPTSGLDPETARMVRDTIAGLRRDGRAIVLSTHNLDEAERLADRIGVLRRRLLAVDAPATLRERLFGRRVRVTLAGPAAPFVDAVLAAGARGARADGDRLLVEIDDPDAATPAIVRALVEAGARIRSVVPDDASLEEVYLRVVKAEES